MAIFRNHDQPRGVRLQPLRRFAARRARSTPAHPISDHCLIRAGTQVYWRACRGKLTSVPRLRSTVRAARNEPAPTVADDPVILRIVFALLAGRRSLPSGADVRSSRCAGSCLSPGGASDPRAHRRHASERGWASGSDREQARRSDHHRRRTGGKIGARRLHAPARPVRLGGCPIRLPAGVRRKDCGGIAARLHAVLIAVHRRSRRASPSWSRLRNRSRVRSPIPRPAAEASRT